MEGGDGRGLDEKGLAQKGPAGERERGQGAAGAVPCDFTRGGEAEGHTGAYVSRARIGLEGSDEEHVPCGFSRGGRGAAGGA